MKIAKAILFDLDGTLIDSEYSHYKCWDTLLGYFGHHLPHNVYMESYSGVSLRKNSQKLIDEYSLDISLEDMIAKREKLMLETFRKDDITQMPYAADIVNHFYQMGVALALVTSSSAEEVEVILQKSDLKGFFSHIITRDDVSNAKPHPEPYLKAVEILGIAKSECVVIEDTLTGVDSAKAAGLACIAVQPIVTPDFRNNCHADALYPHLFAVQQYIEEEYSFTVLSRK